MKFLRSVGGYNLLDKKKKWRNKKRTFDKKN
jgi:hypothetical protein